MKRKILTRIALVVSLIMLLTSTVQTTLGYIYTSTNPITGVFVPELAGGNSITINKTVKHPFGDGYKVPVTFDFEVELGSYYANASITTTSGIIKADQDGVLSVTVTPGTPFVIQNIQKDTVVTVRELSLPASSGFTAENGVTEKQVTVTESGVSADFVNIYTPAAVSAKDISLSGIKELEGRPWQDGDSFSFVLEQKIDGAYVQIGDPATVTYSNADDFNKFDMSALLDNVSFSAVGDHFFRVYEQKGDLENIDYDGTIKEFKVTVTDNDMDGNLEIASVSGTQNVTVSKNGEGYDISVVFNNTFVALPDPDPIKVTVTANKTVNNVGTLTVGPDGFEMVLKDINTSEALAYDTVNGKAEFELTFDKTDVGTHTFELYETDEGLEGMTYDTAKYTVTVVVTLEDNELKATVNGNLGNTFSATFVNVYDADQDEPTPTGDTNKYFWLVMMLISACAFVTLLIIDKRHNARI